MSRSFIGGCLITLLGILLAACGSTPAEPTAPPTLTPFPTSQPQPTRTPIDNASNSVPTTTPLINTNNTTGGAATAILPPTVAVSNSGNSGTASQNTLLTNGRGLTTGGTVTNGQFEVEGYCSILNSQYGVSEDGTDWYCTFNGQRALTLRQEQFNDICQRTYNNSNAIAVQVNNGQPRAYQWRCYQLAVQPTPTSSAPPQLLQNGRGLTTGAVVNNGEFQVEGYCSAINPNYGIDVDNNFWYCTENGNRILTLGVAEFDDICIRTYSNPAAYAEQINTNDRPAYRWRCFAIPS